MLATSSCYEHQQAVIFPFNRAVQAVVLLLPATHRPAELTIHRGESGPHSAEEPGDLRATTGTVEVPITIRDKAPNDAALALGTRPIKQHEPATADGPCHGLHNLHRDTDQHGSALPLYHTNSGIFISSFVLNSGLREAYRRRLFFSFSS